MWFVARWPTVPKRSSYGFSMVLLRVFSIFDGKALNSGVDPGVKRLLGKGLYNL